MNRNNIILTGPPRSGTTLTCFLLNKLSNVVALHEPMNLEMFADRPTAIREIGSFFPRMRNSALQEGKVISKVKSGKIPDNPFGFTFWGKRKSLVKKAKIAVDKPLTPDFTLLIKHNGHFTFLLEDLMHDFPCYAIIRNPLATLASWNSVAAPVARGNLTVLKGLNRELYDHLEATSDLIDRQIKLLHALFKAYECLPSEQIIRYEDIIASGGKALSKIVTQAAALKEPLKSKNYNKLYNQKTVRQIADRLLQSEGDCWTYFSKQEVEALL